MFGFYKKAIALSVMCLMLSVLLHFACWRLSHSSVSLLPNTNTRLPWRALISPDTVKKEGASEYEVRDGSEIIDYEFTLKAGYVFPFVIFKLRFDQSADPSSPYSDLSEFNQVKMRIQCNPANVLGFYAYTLDTQTQLAALDDNMYDARVASTYFRCDKKASELTFDLHQLDVPDWWLQTQGKLLSDKQYDLSKTLALALWNSAQSPKETPSRITVDRLELCGRNWWYLYIGDTALVLFWGWLISLGLRQHTRALAENIKQQLQKDMPLVAYQQLCVEPHRDKEKSAVLHYIATQYANPDLSLDTAIAALGINRNKINELLKAEIGLTFSAYLNKVRLTEAARLLAANLEFNIAEAAYSVGYSNVSYFNKLFKAEYGCTPKAFQAAAQPV